MALSLDSSVNIQCISKLCIKNNFKMKSVLITGTESGLGLGMVKYLIKNKKAEHIFATYLGLSEDLKKIADENKNVHISQLDVKDFAKFDDLAAKIENVVGDNGLNVIINVAGIQNFPTLEEITAEELLSNYMVNTVAPILLTKAVLPLLKRAAVVNSDKPMSIERAAIVNVSSKLGSIAENTGGAKYPYRCSKAAQNAATKSMSIDLKEHNIISVAMHPGWVQTFMGGEGALIDTETSLNGFFETLSRLREEDSGKFLQYNGVEIPW